MRRRTFVLVLALVAVAAAAALYLVRRRNPPRSATLLPASEGVVYIDVGLLRKAGVFSRSRAVERDPEFTTFVRETGFDFERDLDEAAFALHAPEGRADPYPRFSEVFVGRFDRPRAVAYFQKLAQSSEQYRDLTVYSIPHEGRTVRVALLDERTAAVSNAETAAPIRAILDAWQAARAPDPLLARYYGEVPRGSIAWAMARVASPPGVPDTRTALAVPSWLRDMAGGSDVVASLRFTTSLQLRAVAFAPSEPDARRIAQSASSWLAVFRTLAGGLQTSGADRDIKAVFDSLAVQQFGNRVTLSAEVPVDALRKLAEPGK